MSGLEIIFIFIAILTLFSAIKVVTTPKMIHAALWLIATLFGVAVNFVLLNATFLAVVQVVVYVGAIAILMIFAIMLTRKVMEDDGPQVNSNWGWAAVLGLVLFVGLTVLLLNSGAEGMTLPVMAVDFDPIAALGEQLVSPNAFVLPFEVASVLLLAALIGAIAVAWDR